MDEQVKDLVETTTEVVTENTNAVVEAAKNALEGMEVKVDINPKTMMINGAIGGAVALGGWFLGTKGVKFAREKFANWKEEREEKKAEKEAAKAAKKDKKEKTESK